MSISISKFGETDTGELVELFTIKNNNNMTVCLTNWGATVVSIFVPDKTNNVRDVVLGFDDAKSYFVNHCYFGATVGRNANRIGGSSFKINGEAYFLDKNENGKNNLHSGFKGYQKRLWNYTVDESCNSVTFSLHSPDLDQGFPGNLDISVTYLLSDENGLEISYSGICDKDTIVNMTNHSYFNLNGHNSGSVLGHDLKLNSHLVADITPESIPTGELLEVQNTPLDFTHFRRIRR